MVDEIAGIDEGRDDGALPVRPRLTWVAWAAVPVIIALFGVMSHYRARREVHKPMIRTRHILIKCDFTDSAATAEAVARIRDIKVELEAGADFAELARKYSEDPGSASRGGDLGYMTEDDLTDAYAEVALKLEKGEISDIVRTVYGLHIIQLTDRIDPLPADE